MAAVGAGPTTIAQPFMIISVLALSSFRIFPFSLPRKLEKSIAFLVKSLAFLAVAFRGTMNQLSVLVSAALLLRVVNTLPGTISFVLWNGVANAPSRET
jgi:hypothetical protein